jgi:hypothetical protein
MTGKWDVVKELINGVEKAWLEKDEQYVQGRVAAKVQRAQQRAHSVDKKSREKKRKASKEASRPLSL